MNMEIGRWLELPNLFDNQYRLYGILILSILG